MCSRNNFAPQPNDAITRFDSGNVKYSLHQPNSRGWRGRGQGRRSKTSPRVVRHGAAETMALHKRPSPVTDSVKATGADNNINNNKNTKFSNTTCATQYVVSHCTNPMCRGGWLSDIKHHVENALSRPAHITWTLQKHRNIAHQRHFRKDQRLGRKCGSSGDAARTSG